MRFTNARNNSTVSEPTIKVELVYATPKQQYVTKMTVPIGSTAREVIEKSNFLSRFADIDLSKNRVGVYSRLIALDAALKDGDRLEIYRPLTADPKIVRRKLAREGKSIGKKE